MQPRYVVVFVPRNNQILGIAHKFLLTNVNLPWGSVKLGETPYDAAVRVVSEQTRVAVLEARLLSTVEESGSTTYLYYATKFDGRPLPTATGRAFWAEAQQLLRPTADGVGWAQRILAMLLRI